MTLTSYSATACRGTQPQPCRAASCRPQGSACQCQLALRVLRLFPAHIGTFESKRSVRHRELSQSLKDSLIVVVDKLLSTGGELRAACRVALCDVIERTYFPH